MIGKAREYAKKAHEGQFRKDGRTPYFNHVEEVANIVSYFTDNPDIISAAFCHDVFEDCCVDYNDFKEEFNGVVSELVWELTNVYVKENYPDLKRKERKRLECDRLSKISYSGKLIKLADRLVNLKDYQKDPDFNSDHHYVKESRELLEVLRGVNIHLEKEIEDILDNPSILLKETQSHV